MITSKGRELRLTLEHELDRSMVEYSDVLSLICRHATGYSKIQERWCNENMSDTLEKVTKAREFRLEGHMIRLSRLLPGVKSIKFSGDPRGCTVKLVMDNPRLYDDWGQEGICVPGA